MPFDPQRAREALDDLLRHAHDEEFGQADLVSWRTALRAVYQEHAEGEEAQPASWSQRPAMTGYRGWAEATARHGLDAFIDRQELPERLTAALKTVDAEYDDPVACAAADAMAAQIGETHPTLGKSEVLHAVNSESPSEMPIRLSELVVEAHPLAGRDVPDIVSRAVWTDVDQTLHEGFDRIAGAEAAAERDGTETDERLRTGTRIGTETVQALRSTLTEIDGQLEEHGAEQVAAMLQAGTRDTFLASRRETHDRVQRKLAGPRPTDRFEEERRDRRPVPRPPSAGWPGMAPNRWDSR